MIELYSNINVRSNNCLFSPDAISQVKFLNNDLFSSGDMTGNIDVNNINLDLGYETEEKDI